MSYDNINSTDDLYNFIISNIRYGFINNYKEKYYRENTSRLLYEEELFRNYFLQSPKELLISKCGLCFDQTELMKYWLTNHGYKTHLYYSTDRNHSLLIYEYNNNYYWIETTLRESLGIYKANSIDEILNKYLSFNKFSDTNIYIYEYNNLTYGSNLVDVIYKAKNGKLVLKK